MQTLKNIFENTKEILCKYDYYIYTSKKILHLTNSETKIPHLMGMQYIGNSNRFTGEQGVYDIKKERLTEKSIEKLVRKYYKTEEKQRRILELIKRKQNNLHLIDQMFSAYSQLYLYEKPQNVNTEFNCDYLLVHETGKEILHLGIVKSDKNKGIYHCNSFLTTYQSDREKNIFFCHLAHKYEINKIIREDKQIGKKEIIYQSIQAALRENAGIQKMLVESNVEPDEKIIKLIARLNVKFGYYHTFDMLKDTESLLKNCSDAREEALVNTFIKEAQKIGMIQ